VKARLQKIGHVTQCRADEHVINATIDATRYQWLTPHKARIHILNFDGGRPVAPFAFHLRMDKAFVYPPKVDPKSRSKAAGRRLRRAAQVKAHRVARRIGARVARPIARPRQGARGDRRYGVRVIYVNKLIHEDQQRGKVAADFTL
ncbi:MAG: hypothetical protein ACREKH_12760, partial [Candidatus Rokuibacteriota bacterium]